MFLWIKSASALRKNKISHLETTDNTACSINVCPRNWKTYRKVLVMAAINGS